MKMPRSNIIITRWWMLGVCRQINFTYLSDYLPSDSRIEVRLIVFSFRVFHFFLFFHGFFLLVVSSALPLSLSHATHGSYDSLPDFTRTSLFLLAVILNICLLGLTEMR